MFSLVRKARILFLPFDIQLHLFDSMITPISVYGTEVWGCENVDIIDNMFLAGYPLEAKTASKN